MEWIVFDLAFEVVKSKTLSHGSEIQVHTEILESICESHSKYNRK